jgi:hypothetical protein
MILSYFSPTVCTCPAQSFYIRYAINIYSRIWNRLKIHFYEGIFNEQLAYELSPAPPIRITEPP